MNLALNPFDKGKKPETVDMVEVDNKTLKQIIDVFYEFRDYDAVNDPKERKVAFHNRLKGFELTSNDIGLFIASLPELHDREFDAEGAIITYLVQKAYDNGYSRFDFDLCGRDSHVFSEVQANKERPLEFHVSNGYLTLNSLIGLRHCKVKIDCDVHWNIASSCEDCVFVLNGDALVGYGSHAKNCTFWGKTVNWDCGAWAVESEFHVENTERSCGAGSEKSSFYISGDAGTELGKHTSECKFYVGGDVGDDCGFCAKNCTFYAKKKETYKKMLKMVDTDKNKVRMWR